jgi:hypothetical protein
MCRTAAAAASNTSRQCVRVDTLQLFPLANAARRLGYTATGSTNKQRRSMTIEQGAPNSKAIT